MKAYYRLFAPGALFVLMAAGLASATTLPTTTTLTIGPSPGTAGSPITLSASIATQTTSFATGTVAFSEASSPTVIYTSPVMNGVATLILEPPAGSYVYTAVYSGDSTFSGSTSAPVPETVTSSTTTTLTVSPNPALFGAPVTLTATLEPPTSTGTVTFYEHSSIVGVAPIRSGTATFVTTLLPSGLRTLYARYSGDSAGDAPSTSGNVSEAVLTKPGLGFGPPGVIPTGTGPTVQVAGDFNLDGITDLAVLNATSSTIQIFLGTGNGTFTQGHLLTTGPSPVGMAVGDFNGDGFLDLAVAASDGVEVLYGAANGVFDSYSTTAVGTGGASSIAVSDFNKDGLPDIAAVNGSNLVILVSTGPAFNTGLFTTPPLGAAATVATGVGDFNGDGLADIVTITSAGANVLLNTSNLALLTPTYTFATPVIYAAGSGPNAVLIKDVNGDSNQDLLITNFVSGTVTVLKGTGNGTFSSPGTFTAGPEPTSIGASDFNGDGIADLIVTNGSDYTGTSNNITVLLGNGDGTYHQPLAYAAGTGPTAVVVADFNGDAKPDVAVLTPTSNDLDILLNLFATISIIQGNTQTAAVNNTFPLPLEVSTLAFGTPAANVPVTFTAPASGASGFFAGSGGLATVISSPSGIATAPAYTANATSGADVVTATAGGNVVSFALTNNVQTCTFTVSPTGPILFDANGGSILFTVTASAPNCMWNAASSSPSILFGTTSGTGDGTVDVLFPANTTGADLVETVLIAGIPITATILETKQIFADVPPSAYYFDAVNLMYLKGITSGCSTDPLDYCPTNPVTRAQMAVFIVTAVYNGAAFTTSQVPYFTDVPVGSFGFDYIQKMFELGITTGCAPGLFCPTDSVPREQMAVFIIRARYGSNVAFDYTTTPYFTDVPVGSFGYEYIQRMAEDGITSGCSLTMFCPLNIVDRGDMSIFVIKGMFNLLYATTTPEILSITPASIPVGQTTTVTVTGTNTSFDGTTVINPNPAYTVGTVTVLGPTALTVQLTPAANVVTTQPYSIFITTSDQAQEEVLPNGLTITIPN